MNTNSKILLLAILLALPSFAEACTSCNLPLQKAIFNTDFYTTFLKLTTPFLFVGGIFYFIYYRLK
ncbi:MAG TPA: hypothetical protein VIK89_08615 [Cytophagaceae bacterium]